MINAVWSNWDTIGVGDAFLVSLIAIVIVFLVLIIIILITSIFQKGIEVIEKNTQINPRPENSILNEDEDAVIAVLVATIEFHKETGEEARVLSITKVD